MRKGENIRKRKDGRWEGRYIASYSINNKAEYKSIYGHSYMEIKNKLKDIASGGKIQYFPNASNMLVSSLIDEWLEDLKIRVKQSSYSRYYGVTQNHILPELKDLRLKALSDKQITYFVHKLVNTKNLSPKTIHDITSILFQIIKYGEKKNYIANFNYDITLPRTNKNELKILSANEQKKLTEHICNNISNETIGVLLALYTGIRIGELCALQWKDIDLLTGMIKITKTIQRIQNTENDKTKTILITDTPKSQKSTREIPIPDFILYMLNNIKDNASNEAYLLTNDSQKMIEPRIYQRIYKKLIEQAGLEYVNFHTLRHTFATRAIEQGADEKTLSELLGHSTVKFTLEVYVHSSKELKKQCIEKTAVCM